ncbi:endonuclease/exonuclease/phosphatase family protein [Microbispora sp. RL4-1S]|uniref:Endonuclease/exonuclease/phosphatase family protein n=1 Tax=Microbispora oryzae TaxID=2806554 RepID=A0A941ALR9_9ACTN|nr:endonuclease/exonuclease/phosphatase family protein [Microbispora oryzae]MBP2708416.1 endonuclease/exonuclease/phosphatase family protein [Microbispora oryzae]
MLTDRPAPAATTKRPPRWTGRLLLCVAAAWAAFVVLHRLLSGRFWLWLVPDMVPPLVYLVVPLLLLAAAPAAGRGSRRWCAGLAVVSLALGAGQSGLDPAALWNGGGPPAPPGAIRLVSWNTEYWDQGDDPDRFYALLKAQHADVYLLQEYLHWVNDGPRQVDDLARLRREFPGYEITTAGELVTLSRLPVVSTATVGPARALGPAAPWRPVFDLAKVLRTDLRVGGSTLSLYNVHIPTQYVLGENPLSSRFYDTLRARAAARDEQFRGLEADIAGNRDPLLVAGDFNSTVAMGEMRPLFDRLSVADDASRSLLPASWPAGGPALWKLDWTLTSAATVHGYRLLDPGGMSDHRVQEMLLSVGGR